MTEKDEHLRRATVRKVVTRAKEKSPASSVLQPPLVTTTTSGLRDNFGITILHVSEIGRQSD